MEIQKEVESWMKKKKYSYWKPLAILARLTEELGEVAREVNILEGSKKVKKNEARGDLEVELGDLLFTIGALANQMQLDLNKGFQEALKK
jgi:NTP pyrophosphatase (non-canonical NTP hydrolase)